MKTTGSAGRGHGFTKRGKPECKAWSTEKGETRGEGIELRKRKESSIEDEKHGKRGRRERTGGLVKRTLQKSENAVVRTGKERGGVGHTNT